MPAGVDYDLYLYSACGVVLASSTNGGGTTDAIVYDIGDNPGDDSLDYWV